MVSHLDEDHILGLVRLCQALVEGPLDGPQIEPKMIWHNTFASQMLAADEEAGDDIAVLEAIFAEHLEPREAATELRAVIASIGQSEDLQDLVSALGWPVNVPFGGLVRSDGPEGNHVSLEGLELTVLAPNADQLAKLKDQWPDDLRTLAAMESDPDDSPFNLSSIVCLPESESKRALMTGDALGSDVLAALETAELLEVGGSLELDLLKVPHHGSSRNASAELFERLPARHYLISGDGKYGNPDLATLELLLDARPDDDFTLHLTYHDLIEPAGSAPVDFLEGAKLRGRSFGLKFRGDDELSITAQLA
jgi:hypothetical protein